MVCDTGPQVAAANRRDSAHALAAGLVTALGPDLVVLDTVATETDTLLRRRYGDTAGRAFLASLAGQEHTFDSLSPGLLKRAAALDLAYADVGLGLVDGSVMAYAERHRLPILTFDFRDFRATESAAGPWRLLVNEDDLARALGAH